MSLELGDRTELNRWVTGGRPLKGTYFRSVEYRYMNADEVLNGRGTELYGGRFAEVGTKAVYLAESDSAASNEVLTRKKRLGGQSQITIDKYPRVVFGIGVNLRRVVSWLRQPRSVTLAKIRNACLDENDLHFSQEVGALLRDAGVQGLRFPSVAGRGRNLIVYLGNCDATALTLHNVHQLKQKLAEFSKP